MVGEDERAKGLNAADVAKWTAVGGALPFTAGEIASEMAMAARDLAEEVEELETGFICYLDPGEAPATCERFEVLRRRARIFGCLAETFQRIKIIMGAPSLYAHGIARRSIAPVREILPGTVLLAPVHVHSVVGEIVEAVVLGPRGMMQDVLIDTKTLTWPTETA